MKKILSIIICLMITAKLFAQDCSQYVYMQKGKTIESTTFNKAGAVMRKSVNFVSDVSTTNGTTVATVIAEGFDKDGHSSGKKTVTYKCTGGTFSFDMNAAGAGSDKIKFSATDMQYPAGMKVGDHLKDVDMTMEMMGKKMNSKITDMQVVSKESITTPAGTWNALKITYKTTVDMPGMGAMPPETTTQWYVPNFGIVQWQLYGMTIKITSIH